MPEASEPQTSWTRLILPALGVLLMGTVAMYAARSEGALDAAAGGSTGSSAATARDYAHLRHGGLPLENVRDARGQLSDAPVENSHGDPVGAVRDVTIGRGGHPQLVNVAFGGFLGIGAATVPLKAETLGYDPKHNVILTDMTVNQLAVIAHRRETQEN